MNILRKIRLSGEYGTALYAVSGVVTLAAAALVVVFDLALRPFEKFERSGHLVLVPFFQKGGDNIFLHKPWNQP